MYILSRPPALSRASMNGHRPLRDSPRARQPLPLMRTLIGIRSSAAFAVRRCRCVFHVRNLLGWLETRLAQITLNDI